MEKIEVVSKLKKAGYQAQMEGSVIMLFFTGKVQLKQELKKIKSFFTEIGYTSSFGIRQLKEIEDFQRS